MLIDLYETATLATALVLPDMPPLALFDPYQFHRHHGRILVWTFLSDYHGQ